MLVTTIKKLMGYRTVEECNEIVHLKLQEYPTRFNVIGSPFLCRVTATRLCGL